MVIRSLGAFLIIVCGGLWGIFRAASYKRRLQLCDELLEVIGRTSILIRYNCCEAAGIIEELKSFSRIFSEVPAEFMAGDDMGSILCDNVNLHDAGDEERRIILRYCSELGTSDTEGQMSMLDSLKELTAELRRRRAEEYAKYGRLYRSAGILFGLMAGIAII